MKRNSTREPNAMEEAGEASLLPDQETDIRGDEKNIAILLFLYLLQGIPLGLCSAIPMILQKHDVSYKQQAGFSFVIWPFSLKLLWAPIVDSVYIPQFGRRKTWLLPVQYLMGFFMLYLSANVDHWLGNNREEDLNIGLLTALFFILNVLAATQDIVVDGWCLTMLKRCNVSYASTCNTVGQTAGYFLGYVLFLALESADFCNAYLRSVPSDKGIVTLSEFLYYWGIVFIVVTTLVGIFQPEKAEYIQRSKDELVNIKKAYQMLWRTINLPNIKLLMLLLLTAKIGFSASDAVASLKMVEGGMPKEKIALIAVPLIPIQIILPIFISRYTSGPRPMDVYLKALPYRLAFNFIAAFLVWITPTFAQNGEVSLSFMAFIVFLYFFHQLCTTSMFVASMSFYATISDPACGGTYMSFLNTLNNLGGTWTSTVALWLVDTLSFRECSTDSSNDCSTLDHKELCSKTNEGVCKMMLDGFYIESVLCIVIGYFWMRWAKNKILYLQDRPASTWKVFVKDKNKR